MANKTFKLQIIVDKSTYHAFLHACQRNHVTPSKVLHTCCIEYIRNRGLPDCEKRLEHEFNVANLAEGKD